jgi:6-pyruvoyl-tetrahydropterin synthase
MDRSELDTLTVGVLETPLHFSMGILWQESITGYTLEIEPAVGWPLHINTGMIVDFKKIKDAVNKVLRWLDHKMLVPSKHPIIWWFSKMDIDFIEIPDTGIRGIGRFLFEQIHQSIKGDEWEFLQHLTVQFSPIEIYRISGKSVKSEKPLINRLMKDYSQLNFAVNFSHRLEWYPWICHNPHGHTWEICINLRDPLWKEKYTQIEDKVGRALSIHWHNHGIFNERDALKDLFAKHNILHTRWLSWQPTTEEIAWEMFIQVQSLFDKEFHSIRIQSLQLQETPSNKYTLRRKD